MRHLPAPATAHCYRTFTDEYFHFRGLEANISPTREGEKSHHYFHHHFDLACQDWGRTRGRDPCHVRARPFVLVRGEVDGAVFIGCCDIQNPWSVLRSYHVCFNRSIQPTCTVLLAGYIPYLDVLFASTNKSISESADQPRPRERGCCVGKKIFCGEVVG